MKPAPSYFALAIFAAFFGTPHSNFAQASEWSDRFEKFRPAPADLFYEPRTELERKLLHAGALAFWREYGVSTLGEADFRGYILFADPFHFGLKKISFLLGSDCSHFTQRLFQVLGAEFPYAKTRHFIQLGKAKSLGQDARAYYIERQNSDFPIDLSLCRWLELATDFELLAPGAKPEAGDIAVYANAVGAHGEHGHMGVLTQAGSRFLSARNRRLGITEEEANFSAHGETYFFRWRKPLAEREGDSLSTLLEKDYASDPTNCPN